MQRLLPLLLLLACDLEEEKPDTVSDADGDGFDTATDCDDTDSAVSPDADEVCDGVDNNCDGVVDEDSATDALTFYTDSDGDGYGGVSGEAVVACALSEGLAEDQTDCDDSMASINPGAEEVCDGIDNNCDDGVDTDATDAEVWYPDEDGDGFGDPEAPRLACQQPADYISDSSDCDDTDHRAKPGADELCDGVDNNCDGTVDEDSAIDAPTWYADTDGDGFGDEDVTTRACYRPSGYVADDSDCDDTTAEEASCQCTLDSIGTATTVAYSGSIYGAWMADPEETLGSDLHWEMDSYSGYTVTEYPSLADVAARTNSSSTALTTQYEGTGGIVLDGYLYYPEYNTNTIIKYDLDLGKEVGTLDIPDAGYHNTYYYQWGGYSDIDLEVDSSGLWVIYGTSANSGRLVVSSIDTDKFTVTDTWETASATKTSIGNAFMICGVLYATSSYTGSTVTINYAYDTYDETDWDPGISMPVTYNYLTQISYNPDTELLYVWDYSRRVTFTTSTSN